MARRLEVKAKAGAVARPSETSGDSYPEAGLWRHLEVAIPDPA